MKESGEKTYAASKEKKHVHQYCTDNRRLLLWTKP